MFYSSPLYVHFMYKVTGQSPRPLQKLDKLCDHLRKVGIEVIRGVKVEGARHQVRRQRRPVQAARVVCPPRWTKVLGTKEQEEKTPEKSQVVILNRAD